MIKEKLQEIGFTRGEAEVYSNLISLGQTKVNALMRITKVSYSKLYEILDKLAKKGLASKVRIENVLHYQALPPQHIIDYIELQKAHLTKAQDEIKKIAPLINANMQNQEQSAVRLFLGSEGPRIVLKELIAESIVAHSNYGYGTNDNPFITKYPDEMHDFFEAENKYKFKTYLLFSKNNKQKQPAAQIKYVDSENIPPVRTMMAGSKVFLVSFGKPITSIIIDNKQIAENYIKHFLILWKQAVK